MEIIIFCGKGGVGKTTSAVSTALCLSEKQKVALIDYDGGHSTKENLGIKKSIPENSFYQVKENLELAIIENFDYQNIMDSKEANKSFDEYMSQFLFDHGIIPFADMVTHFFGVPTDIPTTQKFILLVGMLLEAEEKGIEYVIIDVEPTAGFERLLSNSHSMIRSLKNLKNKGVILLGAVSLSWPDIGKYLKSDYIKNIDFFTNRIKTAVSLLKEAKYILVCIPEKIPVQQSFEVRKIIEKFGGNPCGYIINNIRNEPHEKEQLEIIHTQGLPVIEILRQPLIHQSGNDKHLILMGIGIHIGRIFI